MTGNEIMWKTVKHMQTQPIQNTYIDITKEWKVYDEKTQRTLRDAMRLAPVISLNDQNHCEIKLRSEGYDAKEEDFKIGGRYYKDRLDYEIHYLSLWHRLSNRKFVWYNIKYVIKKGTIYGVKFIIDIWKIIVLIAIAAIGGWLTLDHNFKDVINWIKNHLFK